MALSAILVVDDDPVFPDLPRLDALGDIRPDFLIIKIGDDK